MTSRRYLDQSQVDLQITSHQWRCKQEADWPAVPKHTTGFHSNLQLVFFFPLFLFKVYLVQTLKKQLLRTNDNDDPGT